MSLDHKLALPPHPGMMDEASYGHEHPEMDFLDDHFQNPFAEDDDLLEWTKVLSHCGGNDPDPDHAHGHPNHRQPGFSKTKKNRKRKANESDNRDQGNPNPNP